MSSVNRGRISSEVEAPLGIGSQLIDGFAGRAAYLTPELVFARCDAELACCFGISQDEVNGRSLHDVAPNHPALLRDIERIVATAGQPEEGQVLISSERPDQDGHDYVVSYHADRDVAGRIRGVFMASLDVTASVAGRHEATKALLERNETLEKMLQEKELLIGIISHELRTPLSTIFGNAHLLQRRLDEMDVPTRTAAISDIRTEAERLNRLVENMLLLARSGAQEPVPTVPISLIEAIDEMVSDQRSQLGGRPISVSVKPSGLKAMAQPDYFRQVLQNLFSNAAKYSPPHQTIDLRARRRGAEVTISILDRGPGIDPAEAQIVFQPFYRSARTSSAVGGAGIGLAVCKLLVQAQSGSIHVQPRRGGGTVFTVALPSAPEAI